MNLFEEKKVIYTAQSKHFFYAKMLICKYVLEHNAVPLNPFNIWGYFLDDMVDRDLVRQGNNNVVRIVDETWVFGKISDGVLAEIEYTQKFNKPLRFFSVSSKYSDIKPIEIESLEFEKDALIYKTAEEIKKEISQYISVF
jgi:hypothetical protein